MKAVFAPSHLSGAKTLYALTAFVLAAATWAYFTPIDISVRARGIVRPEGDPIRIIAEVAGRITEIYVREGVTVHRGDALLQLDTRELRLREKTLEARIHFAELRLADLQRQVDDTTLVDAQSAFIDAGDRDAARRTARANVESARLKFARADVLLDQGLIARQVHDEARLALAQAEAEEFRVSTPLVELKRLQAETRLRELTASATPLRAELAAHYHELEQTRLQLNRLTITSPADGRITSLVSLHADELLAAGTAVAAIVPRSHPLVIESWLPTAERAYVRPGQFVRLQTEAFPADQYDAVDGAVLSISPDARFNESLNGAFRVLISPASSTPELHLGMTFQVHFITRQKRLLMLLFQKIRRGFEADEP